MPTQYSQRTAAELTPERDRELMQWALECARQAYDAGEVPVGAVLVDESGAALARAANGPIASHDPTAHAEVLALRAAGAQRRNYRLPGTTMYVTLEPCVMCVGALIHARVTRLVFAASDPKTGACGSVFDLAATRELNHRIEVTRGVLAADSTDLLRRFFAERR